MAVLVILVLCGVALTRRSAPVFHAADNTDPYVVESGKIGVKPYHIVAFRQDGGNCVRIELDDIANKCITGRGLTKEAPVALQVAADSCGWVYGGVVAPGFSRLVINFASGKSQTVKLALPKDTGISVPALGFRLSCESGGVSGMRAERPNGTGAGIDLQTALNQE